MNNDKLKKKIAEIIDTTKKPCECLTVSECLRYENCKYQKREAWSCKAYAIAEALIAAGIGDVKEAEHRVEKAEKLKNQYCRALLNLARRYVVKTNMTLPHGNEPHSRSTDIEMLALYIMANECEQAEKELAEENSGKKEV